MRKFTFLGRCLFGLATLFALGATPSKADEVTITEIKSALSATNISENISSSSYYILRRGAKGNAAGMSIKADGSMGTATAGASGSSGYVVTIAGDNTNGYTFKFFSTSTYITQNGETVSTTETNADNATKFTLSTFTGGLDGGTTAETYVAITSVSQNGYGLNAQSQNVVGWYANRGEQAAYEIVPVTISNFYTLTYNLKNSAGTVLYTTTRSYTGDVPAAPWSSVDGFYEISGTMPTEAKDATVDFTFSQKDGDIPKISTSATDDGATWYTIKARTDRPLIAMSTAPQCGIYCNPFGSYKFTDLFKAKGKDLTYDDIKNAQLWCVTGDPANGFRFINKMSKAAIAVGQNSNDGTNAVLRLDTTNSFSLFDITTATNNGSTVYQAAVHGGTQYLSDWGGDSFSLLKFYSKGAADDAGSALTFGTETQDITTANLEAASVNDGNGWVGSHTTTVTVPESTTNKGEALFKECVSKDTVAIEADKYYKIRLNRSDVKYDDAKKFWWSSSSCTVPTDGKITMDNYSGYDRNIQRVAESDAEVPKLFQFESVSDTENGYKIKNVNTSKYLCNVKSDSPYASLDLPVEEENAGIYVIEQSKSNNKASNGTTWNFCINSYYINATYGVDYANISNWNGNSVFDAGNNWSIIPVTEIPLTIYSDTQYASACYPFGVTLPETLQAYIATAASSNSASTETGKTGEVTLKGIGTSVPANKPVIIGLADNAEAITTDTEYNLTINNEATANTEGNILTGATVARKGYAENTIYVLTTDGTNAVMRPNLSYTSGETTTFLDAVTANHAYLDKSKITFTQGEGNATSLRFNFGDTPTGIHTVNAQSGDEGADTYYDLRGRRVLYPAHGIYVKGNGQKVYIK